MTSAASHPDLLATAADDRLDAASRRTALIDYFRAKAPQAPLPLGGPGMLGDPRLAAWFAADRLTDMTSGARMPVDRKLGQGVILFMPNLPPGDRASVYLLLSSQPTIAQFLAWSKDPATCPASIQVVQIAFGQSTPGSRTPQPGTP
jgi:hypothetical protein